MWETKGEGEPKDANPKLSTPLVLVARFHDKGQSRRSLVCLSSRGPFQYTLCTSCSPLVTRPSCSFPRRDLTQHGFAFRSLRVSVRARGASTSVALIPCATKKTHFLCRALSLQPIFCTLAPLVPTVRNDLARAANPLTSPLLLVVAAHAPPRTELTNGSPIILPQHTRRAARFLHASPCPPGCKITK